MSLVHIGYHFCACGEPAYRKISGGEFICERCDRLEAEHQRRMAHPKEPEPVIQPYRLPREYAGANSRVHSNE